MKPSMVRVSVRPAVGEQYEEDIMEGGMAMSVARESGY